MFVSNTLKITRGQWLEDSSYWMKRARELKARIIIFKKNGDPSSYVGGHDFNHREYLEHFSDEILLAELEERKKNQSWHDQHKKLTKERRVFDERPNK